MSTFIFSRSRGLSKNSEYPKGKIVTGSMGWTTYSVVDPGTTQVSHRRMSGMRCLIHKIFSFRPLIFPSKIFSSHPSLYPGQSCCLVLHWAHGDWQAKGGLNEANQGTWVSALDWSENWRCRILYILRCTSTRLNICQ